MSDDLAKPNWSDNGVPFCSEEACPAYDGKRCEYLGHRPDSICEPTVVLLAMAAEEWKDHIDNEANLGREHAAHFREFHPAYKRLEPMRPRKNGAQYRILSELLRLLDENLENVAKVVDRQSVAEAMAGNGMPMAAEIWFDTANMMAAIVADQQHRLAELAISYAEAIPDTQTIATEQWGVISIARLRINLTGWIEPDLDTIRQAYSQKQDDQTTR